VSLKESETEEIKRILPLGLTPTEAKGWYIRAVLRPWLIKSIVAVSVGFSALLSVLSPLGTYLESTLTLHMLLQHFLYIAAGFLLVYGVNLLVWVGSTLSNKVSSIYSNLLRVNSMFSRYGIVILFVASLVVGYWYLPNNFDAAFLQGNAHVEMHLSLLGAGGLIYLGSRVLTKRVKQFAPVVVGKAMGLFGALMLVTPNSIYSVYPVAEQTQAGVTLVVIMLVVDLTLMPIFLYNYFGKNTHAKNHI
jgi:cytochrome c oxidase assembly factor CtaG